MGFDSLGVLPFRAKCVLIRAPTIGLIGHTIGVLGEIFGKQGLVIRVNVLGIVAQIYQYTLPT